MNIFINTKSLKGSGGANINSDFKFLELKKDEEGIGTIIFNRPECKNALNIRLAEDLIKALENCCEDEEISAVIITGKGDSFCSGGDLKASQESNEKPEYWKSLTRRLNRIIVNIRYTRKPVIASINGAVAGAGMSIATACDIRIAGKSGYFKQAWTSIGLVPDGAWTLIIPLTLGMGRASEMIFMDPVIDAEKAYEIGLVNLVTPDDKLEETTREWAKRFCQGPFEALARSKELLNESMLHILEAQLGRERREIIEAAKTEDFLEGNDAFLNKRPPPLQRKIKQKAGDSKHAPALSIRKLLCDFQLWNTKYKKEAGSFIHDPASFLYLLLYITNVNV